MASHDLPIQENDVADPQVRVDCAHPQSGETAPSGPVATPDREPTRSAITTAVVRRVAEEGGDAAEAVDVTAPSGDGVAEHAAELASRLQRQLHELDRRESRLNAQEAEFDSRLRSARLWIAQRENELEQQEKFLAEQSEKLKQQHEGAEATIAEAGNLADRLEQVTAREQQVDRLQVELEVGVREQQTRLDALDFETAACRTKQQELDQAREACEQRQRLLDQREAELYASQERLAEQRVEHDRQVRLWTDREAALGSRERTLRQWEGKLREEASAAEFARKDFEQQVCQHQQDVEALAAQERRLRVRQQEIETALQRFERLGIVEQRLEEVQSQQEELEIRSGYLDRAEALLTEQQQELLVTRDELEAQRRSFENRVTQDRKVLAEQRGKTHAELQRREQQLETREQTLDQREAALETLSGQLRDGQREILETRLAVEETWLQLQGALAPATLTRSVANLRNRLADHYRLLAEEVDAKKNDLEHLRQELAEKFSETEQRQARLTAWSEQHQRDLQNHASRLVAREQELDQQEREFSQAEASWQAERREYRTEIQRLLSQLRSAEATAAA